MIDNTQRKTSPDTDQAIHKQAVQNQKQLVAYQQKQEQESQVQAQQAHLANLLKQWAQPEKKWVATKKITPSMTRLLTQLAEAKEVVIAMTEEQVKQAWGEPTSESVTIVDNQPVKTWTYPNGKQVTLQAGRVQALK